MRLEDANGHHVINGVELSHIPRGAAVTVNHRRGVAGLLSKANQSTLSC